MNRKELIGRRLRELRRKKGLSQEALSEKAEITSNYLSRLERGTENPTLDTLIRIADALEIEMWEMFDFGHTIGRKDLKSLLNKLAGEAEEEELRLAVKIFRAVKR